MKNLKDHHPVNHPVKILYQQQKNRGQQGFGFVGLNAKRIDICRATLEKEIFQYLEHHDYDEIIFHHRLPTSTKNTLESTHPFVIELAGKIYYFVHNGIITNAEKLKKEHSQKGITYSSKEGKGFNDSEALGWDFCLWLNHKKKKIEATGSVAFVCLETDKETNQAGRLYFYRNDSAPLTIYQDKTLFLLASEGGYTTVKKNWLYFWDYQRKRIRKYQFLKIENPKSFVNEYDYRYWDYEIDDAVDLTAIKAKITTLEQERDYLVSVGKSVEAEAVDEEIEDLKDQLKEMKHLLNFSNLTNF